MDPRSHIAAATQAGEMAPPATIRFGRTALAAGLAGHSINLVYQEFPLPLVAEIWKVHAAEVGGSGVLSVETRRDLKKLARLNERKTRLVFVRDGRLLREVSWTINFGSVGTAAKQASFRPAVLAVAGTTDVDEAPGARLDLYASSKEQQAIASWLQHRQMTDTKHHSAAETVISVLFPEPFEEFCWPSVELGLARWRDCQVFRGLLAGTAVQRHLEHNDKATTDLTVTKADYEMLHKLLNGPLARPADEPFADISLWMVARANVYLDMLYHKWSDPKQDARMGDDEACRARHITRRELQDLGNPGSQAARLMIAFLLKQEQGFETFRTLGLRRKLSTEKGWPQPKEVETLALMLCPWTEKQVRSHFDKLRKDKVIDADRPLRNGAWQYVVPEALTSRSAFHNLPKPADIRAQMDAGTNVSASQMACPACPSLAQPAGQTEVEERSPVTSKEGSIAPIPAV